MKPWVLYSIVLVLLGNTAGCGGSEPAEPGTDAAADAAGPADAASAADAGAPVDAGEPIPWNEGQWVVGRARFTVVTPTLVRLEHDPAGRFVDPPSYFAVEREARFHHATLTQDGAAVRLD